MKASPTVLEMLETMTGKKMSISNIMPMIEQCSPEIFSWYQIFDEDYREVLNGKILAHYLNYQIGAESIPLFLFNLNRKMNEIMPYYNQLYEIAIKINDADLGENMDYTEEFNQAGKKIGSVSDSSKSDNSYEESSSSTRNDSGNVTSTNKEKTTDSREDKTESSSISHSDSDTKGSSTANTDTDNWNKNSDTPQGNINGVRDTTYLTNLSHVEGNENSTGSSKDTSTVDSTATGNVGSTVNGTTDVSGSTSNTSDNTETISGSKSSSASNILNATKGEQWDDTLGYVKHIYGVNNYMNVLHQLIKVRDAIMNVDMMVIEALAPCFFGMW